MKLSRDLFDRLVAHARSEAPNECCGIIGVVEGSAVDFYPARNRFNSPLRFEIHPDDLFRINAEIEERGQTMALYHSHPNTEGVPSQTDVNLASWWPGIDWIICSLEGGEAVVRGFAIDGPAVTEVELVVH